MTQTNVTPPPEEEPPKVEPVPVEVEPQEAPNPILARLEQIEDGINKITTRQDERDKRDRAGRRAGKFKAARENKNASVTGRKVEADKQTKERGDTSAKSNDTTIQRGHRFKFRRKQPSE